MNALYISTGTSAASAKSSLLVALAPSVVYPEIRRLTFVVSGGKGVRGKYDLSLYKECKILNLYIEAEDAPGLWREY
ncbi:hypothetical protein TL16_g10467 [Triparma laevis f. inornata]|uniref:Uncharacterized protein n=1 Tax=Triparma laevis f. inornata TaxID=1714386 RepID=A0A9W7BGB1_9STRA|nr:hypothetical protein TL16_g10467 [Triparma laevis f. inornata]